MKTRSKVKKDKYYKKVQLAVHQILKETTVVTPAEVFIRIGNLDKRDFEDWRFGRVSCLERVINCNLSRARRILLALRIHAEERGLKPSRTVYKKWGKGKKILLRFSKSGIRYMEDLYSTHYIAGVVRTEGGIESKRTP